MGFNISTPPTGALDANAGIKQVARQQERFNQSVRRTISLLGKTGTDGASFAPGSIPPSALLAPGSTQTQGAVPFEGAPNGRYSYLQHDPTNFSYNQQTAVLSLGKPPIISSLTIGSILYVGSDKAIHEDNANLFYDFTHARVGIGTAVPTVALDVNGDIRDRNLTAGSLVIAVGSGVLGQDNANAFYDTANHRLGLGMTAPVRTLEILNTSAAQVRVTYTAASVYTDLQTNSSGVFIITPTGGFQIANVNHGFFGATPVAKPTVTGSKGGNVALGSLMTALSSLGLVVDSTT